MPTRPVALARVFVLLACALLLPGIAEGQCSRDRPCANNGTCEARRSPTMHACLLYYGGPLCETPVYPACRLTTERVGGLPPVVFCNPWVEPRSCECIRQCFRHQSILRIPDDRPFPCFEREGLPPEKQLSAVPALDEPGVRFWSNFLPFGPSKAGPVKPSNWSLMMADYYGHDLQRFAVPNEQCPDACGWHGVCIGYAAATRAPDCACLQGREGPSCELEVPWDYMCPGDDGGCNGHGGCIRGVCSCYPGWFGYDCSIDLSRPDAANLGIVMLDPIAHSEAVAAKKRETRLAAAAAAAAAEGEENARRSLAAVAGSAAAAAGSGSGAAATTTAAKGLIGGRGSLRDIASRFGGAGALAAAVAQQQQHGEGEGQGGEEGEGGAEALSRHGRPYLGPGWVSPYADKAAALEQAQAGAILGGDGYGGWEGGARGGAVPGRVGQPPRVPLRVYMYELPAWLNVACKADTGSHQHSFGDGMYSADLHLRNKLLTDWEVRTLDGESADVFMWITMSFDCVGNVGDPRELLEKQLRYIDTHYPYWGRKRGADHAFVTVQDRGVKMPPEGFGRAIMATQFGYVEAHLIRSLQQFHPMRDVTIPPECEMDWFANSTFGQGMHPHAPPFERTTLFLFIGSLQLHELYYSGGTRQRAFVHFHDRPGIFVDHVKLHARLGYLPLLQQALFCFCTSGEGWDQRLVNSISAGCIPVVALDGLYPPFFDILPYEDMIVRVAEADIEQIEDILRAIPPERVRHMQRVGRRFHRYFYYLGDGLAYRAFLASLARRRGLLPKGWRLPAPPLRDPSPIADTAVGSYWRIPP